MNEEAIEAKVARAKYWFNTTLSGPDEARERSWQEEWPVCEAAARNLATAWETRKLTFTKEDPLVAVKVYGHKWTTKFGDVHWHPVAARIFENLCWYGVTEDLDDHFWIVRATDPNWKALMPANKKGWLTSKDYYYGHGQPMDYFDEDNNQIEIPPERDTPLEVEVLVEGEFDYLKDTDDFEDYGQIGYMSQLYVWGRAIGVGIYSTMKENDQ